MGSTRAIGAALAMAVMCAFSAGCGIERSGLAVDGGMAGPDTGRPVDAGPDGGAIGEDGGDAGETGEDGGAPDAGGIGFAEVSCGGLHGCRLHVDGSLQCWGTNVSGQVGTGDVALQPSPVPIYLGARVATVDAGGAHTCAIDGDGLLFCWGDNEVGQLGLGHMVDALTPTPVGTDRWLTVSAGEQHTCGIRDDSTLWCWGETADGRLGIGSASGPKLEPQAVEPDSRFRSVSAGQDFTCAIRRDGLLFCWGMNDKGQAGINTTSRSTPAQIHDATDWVGVTTGGDHACGLHADGTLHCWGRNHKGQLGDIGMDGPALRRPVGLWSHASAGTNHTCGVRRDGSLACWGEGALGRLGNGGAADQHVPTDTMGPLGAWRRVSANRAQTCAIFAADGQVYCFGSNTDDQLGLGDEVDRLVPTLQ